jgi:Apea-like HEPN
VSRFCVPLSGFYRLTSDDAPLILQLFEKLEKLADDNQLALALRRYNDAHERVRPEDKIVDCWIGLEALFASDASQEVTFRVSLRAAKLIGSDEEHRFEIYKRLKKLYKTRSSVVHGVPVERPRLERDATDTLEFLRTGLLRWLELSGQVPEQLDRQLLR